MNELKITFDGDVQQFTHDLMDKLIATVSNFEKVEIYVNPEGEDSKKSLEENGSLMWLENDITIYYADDVDVVDIQAEVDALKA